MLRVIFDGEHVTVSCSDGPNSASITEKLADTSVEVRVNGFLRVVPRPDVAVKAAAMLMDLKSVLSERTPGPPAEKSSV